MQQTMVSVEQAQDTLDRWIQAVGRGETVLITRGGRPVAALVRPPAAGGETDVAGPDPALVSLLAWEDSEEMLRFLGES